MRAGARFALTRWPSSRLRRCLPPTWSVFGSSEAETFPGPSQLYQFVYGETECRSVEKGNAKEFERYLFDPKTGKLTYSMAGQASIVNVPMKGKEGPAPRGILALPAPVVSPRDQRDNEQGQRGRDDQPADDRDRNPVFS